MNEQQAPEHETILTLLEGIANRVLESLGSHDEFGLEITSQDRDSLKGSIITQLFSVVEAFRGLEGIKNKRILVLGSGAKPERGFADGYQYNQPWFCRGLRLLDAEPVAVDLYPSRGEAFAHLTRDLSQPGALSFLIGHSFDGVQARLLMDSPQNPSYGLATEERMVLRNQMAKELAGQINRLLKIDGKVLYLDSEIGTELSKLRTNPFPY